MVRSLAAILEQIDVTYEIAGQTLGASKLTAARTITLPLFRAGLVTGIILCFSRSLSETGGTMIALATMANAAGFNTGPTLIGEWKKLSVTHPELIPQLSFVSILLIIIALILLAILKVIVMKVRLPFGKVWPRPEKNFESGLCPEIEGCFFSCFSPFLCFAPFLLYFFICCNGFTIGR
jgi:ABC-type sulfate transport system permease component